MAGHSKYLVILTAHTLGACLRGSAVTDSFINERTNAGDPFFHSRRKMHKWPVFVQVCRSHDVSSAYKRPLYLPLSRSRHRFVTFLLYVRTFLLYMRCYSEHTGSSFVLNVRNLIRVSRFYVADCMSSGVVYGRCQLF